MIMMMMRMVMVMILIMTMTMMLIMMIMMLKFTVSIFTGGRFHSHSCEPRRWWPSLGWSPRTPSSAPPGLTCGCLPPPLKVLKFQTVGTPLAQDALKHVETIGTLFVFPSYGAPTNTMNGDKNTWTANLNRSNIPYYHYHCSSSYYYYYYCVYPFFLRYRHPDWPFLLKQSLPCQAPCELGVQAPVGFWDPLGLSADGDVGGLRPGRDIWIIHIWILNIDGNLTDLQCNQK